MKILALIIVSVAGCGVITPDVPKKDKPACESACENLTRLGCEESEPDSNGVSCVVLCQETMAGGLVDLEPDRVALITECP